MLSSATILKEEFQNDNLDENTSSTRIEHKSDIENDMKLSSMYIKTKLASEICDDEVEKFKMKNTKTYLENFVSIKEEYEDDYLDNKMLICETTTNMSCIQSQDYTDDEEKKYILSVKNCVKLEVSTPEISAISINEKVKLENDINLKFNNQQFFLETMQCKFCKICIEHEEYLKYHLNNCCQNSIREDVLLPVSNDEMIEVAKYSSILNKHKKQRGIYKCSQCKYKTRYKTDMKNHTNKHFEVKAFICGFCHKRFKRKATLNFHINNTHTDIERKDTYQCSLCNYKTNLKPYLGAHMRTKHCETKKYKCSKCDYKTTYRVTFRRHLETHETVKQFTCSKCEYATNSKYRLKIHNYKHVLVKRYKCLKCDYETHHQYRLTDHFFNKHGEEKRFNCSKCEYKTNYTSNLKEHIKLKHSKKEMAKIKCTACDYETHRKHRLKEHFFNKHETVKRFKCTDCDYETNSKSNLKKHTNAKHSEENKFTCAQCGYETGYRCSLINHLRSHEQLKRFQCLECNFKTKYEGYLKEHVNVRHRKIKKYKCSICEYATAYKTSLKNHLFSHEVVKRFKCVECEFETNHKSYFKAHVNKKHCDIKQM